MRRRELIAGLGGAAAWPLAVRAQQGERVRRVGALIARAENDRAGQAMTTAFRRGLGRLGWVEGKNIRIEFRYAIPSAGPHGLDLDLDSHRLFCACDSGELITLGARSGKVLAQNPLSGSPDVVFFRSRAQTPLCCRRRPGHRIRHENDGEAWKCRNRKGAHLRARACWRSDLCVPTREPSGRNLSGCSNVKAACQQGLRRRRSPPWKTRLRSVPATRHST